MTVNPDGSVYAPIIIPLPAPSMTKIFDPAALWLYQSSTLAHASMPLAPKGHVLVRIIEISASILGCMVFSGTVNEEPYTGITFGPLSNFTMAHPGTLLPLPCHSSSINSVRLLASIIAVLALGHANFTNPTRLEGSSILVTHSDSKLGRELCAMYQSRGLTVLCLPTGSQIVEVRQMLSRNPAYMVSGRDQPTDGCNLDTIIHSIQGRRVWVWDNEKNGIPRFLAEDPWAIGDALKSTWPEMSTLPQGDLIAPIRRLPTVPQGEVPMIGSIFSPDKAYILVGGIGGLGIPVAYWMYQVGHRL